MESRGKRILWFFVGLIVVAVASSIMLTWALKGSSYQLPFNVELPTIDIGQIIEFVLIQIILAVVVFYCVLILMKVIKKPVLNFLNHRWLPKAENEVILTGEVKNKEIYQTSIGEEFELIVRESWMMMIVLKILPNIIKIIVSGFVVGIVASIIASIFALSFFPKIMLSSIVIFLIYSAIIPDYLVKEWCRLHSAIILFSQKIVFTHASGGGLIGLITGKVADIQQKETPYSLDQEPEMVTDPRKLKNEADPPDDLLNKFYEYFGRTRGMRCLFIPSFFKNASDLFMFVENGNGTQRIIKELKRESAETSSYLDSLNRKINETLTGRLDDKNWNQKQAEEMAAMYYSSRTNHLAKPRVYNLVALLNKDEDELNKNWNIPEGERRFKRKNAVNPQMDVSDRFDGEKIPFSENVSQSSEGQVVFPDKED